MAKDVYLPLMMGDWIRGTRGMKAEVKGVYIGLLIHQYDEGYIPSDIETLSLIEPEVGKVWVILKSKFQETSPGKLQNIKLEEVRSFWQKQRNNGKNGGRPKQQKPKPNPNHNPKPNPNHNLHIDSDYDNDFNNKNEPDFFKPDVRGDELVFPIDTPEVRQLWARWKEYRWKEYEAKYGMMGEQADLKRLQKMDYLQIEKTILTAIAGKWKNLYPNEQRNGKQQTRTFTESVDRISQLVDQQYPKGATG